MKTIVQINTTLNYGSTGRIAEQIGLLVKSMGWRSIVVHGVVGVNPSSLESIQCGNWLDNRFHAFETVLFGRDGLGSVLATKILVHKLKKISPDIVHLHNIHGHFINYQVLFDYLAKAKIKTVWTFHDCWPITGGCPYFDMLNCYKWKNDCGDCLYTKQKRRLIDSSAKHHLLKKKLFASLQNLNIVTVSKWLEDLVNESFFGPQNNVNVKTIHNGVDVDCFRLLSRNEICAEKEKRGIKGKKIILGVAAPWTERKGLSDFLKLRKKLNDNYLIVLVGLSQTQINEMPEGIIGIQRTECINELVMLYNIADLFVNPTYEDNFPTTNIEALACGTPIITYKTGGSVEAVEKDMGMVVEKGDVNGLYDSILSFNNSTDDNIRNACREIAEQKYNHIVCFAEYMELYKNIFNDQSSSDRT